MNDNTIVSNDSDSGCNKRKRSLKENEGKTSQKKTLWSYFHSSKTERSENLNGTDFKLEVPVCDGQTSENISSENGELENNMETMGERAEPEKNNQDTSQCAFKLNSLITEPGNLNETEVKLKTSSEIQLSPSTSTGETSVIEDNVKSVDKAKEHEKTSQDSFQVASTSAINEFENLNGIEVEEEILISEIQTSASTSQRKVTENERPQGIAKNEDDNEEQEKTNQECLQIDLSFFGEELENLIKNEVKPGPSSKSQASASTSKRKANSNEDNQGNAEMKESGEASQESSQMAFKPHVDWRSSCYDVTGLLNKARKEGLFTDIQFVMGKGDRRREFRAHKSILACASSVFEEMFFGPLPEERNIIETDDDPDSFEMLLDYIYGTSHYICDSKSLTSVCRFSIIGNKYLVPKVQETIKDFIFFHSITETDFWDVFEVSNFESLWPLFRDKLDSYIMENAEVLVPSEKFLNVPETIINNILQMDKLNIDEYELLIGVTKWVYHNKKEVTAKILMEYYKHIRFSRVSSCKLIQFIDSYPEALDAETYLRVLQHIHSPSAHELPEWCSSNKKCRIEALELSKHGCGCSCRECNDNSGDDAGCNVQ